MGTIVQAHNHEQVRILATLSTMLVLSTGIFFLRLWARRISVARYWWDDYMAGAALILSYGPIICVIIAVHFGLGRHIGTDGVSASGAEHVFILAWLTQTFWQLTLPAVKTSLLLFYIRLFPGRRMRLATYIVGAIMWAFGIATTIVDLAMCTPVNFFWDKSIPGGRCINQNAFYITGSSVQLLTDVVILLIPLPAVWSLQINNAKKIALSIIFLLGSFVCGASATRIVLVGQFIPKDITGLAVNVAIWTCIEASLGVICACIPCLTPLVLKVVRMRKQQTPQDTNDAMKLTHQRATFGKENGFERMDEFPELGATFEMTIYGESYADCRVSERLPDDSLPENGINVTKEVNVKQTSIRR